MAKKSAKNQKSNELDAQEFFAAIALIENTAIVGFIALKDMTKVTDIIRSQTYDSLIPLVIVGVIYYLIARLLALLFDKLGNMLIRKRAAQ